MRKNLTAQCQIPEHNIWQRAGSNNPSQCSKKRKEYADHKQMVSTCLFYQIHKSGSKTPRLVSVALQGADSHLGGTLGGHCYHVNSIIHQSCFSLHEKTEKLSLMYTLCPVCFSLLRTVPSGYCYGKGHYRALHRNLRCKKSFCFFSLY